RPCATPAPADQGACESSVLRGPISQADEHPPVALEPRTFHVPGRWSTAPLLEEVRVLEGPSDDKGTICEPTRSYGDTSPSSARQSSRVRSAGGVSTATHQVATAARSGSRGFGWSRSVSKLLA